MQKSLECVARKRINALLNNLFSKTSFSAELILVTEIIELFSIDFFLMKTKILLSPSITVFSLSFVLDFNFYEKCAAFVHTALDPHFSTHCINVRFGHK